jgi:hypothetical protein
MHAVTGWWQYLPAANLTATILPFTERFFETPLDRALRDEAFPAPSMMSAFGYAATSYMPRAISQSVYSSYSAGYTPCRPWNTLRSAIDAITLSIFRATAPTYTYLYVPFVDSAEHTHGPHAGAVRRVLARVQRDVARLAEQLAGRARIVVTADHGLIGRSEMHVWTRNDPLMAMQRFPPSGEPRAPYFHLHDGRHEEFAEAFRARYGDSFALITPAEAASCGLFGPEGMSDETHRRLGDFVGVALGADTLVYEPEPSLAAMNGFHGGMLPEEMRIPLVLA